MAVVPLSSMGTGQAQGLPAPWLIGRPAAWGCSRRRPRHRPAGLRCCLTRLALSAGVLLFVQYCIYCIPAAAALAHMMQQRSLPGAAPPARPCRPLAALPGLEGAAGLLAAAAADMPCWICCSSSTTCEGGGSGRGRGWAGRKHKGPTAPPRLLGAGLEGGTYSQPHAATQPLFDMTCTACWAGERGAPGSCWGAALAGPSSSARSARPRRPARRA